MSNTTHPERRAGQRWRWRTGEEVILAERIPIDEAENKAAARAEACAIADAIAKEGEK